MTMKAKLTIMTAQDGCPIDKDVDFHFPENGIHVNQAFREVIKDWAASEDHYSICTFSGDLLNGLLNYAVDKDIQNLVEVHLNTKDRGLLVAKLEDGVITPWSYGALMCSEGFKESFRRSSDALHSQEIK